MKLTDIQVELLKEEEKDLLKKTATEDYNVEVRRRLDEIGMILKVYEPVAPEKNQELNIGKEFMAVLNFGDDEDKELVTGILVESKPTPNQNLISITSPLGDAINHKKVNDEFRYTVQKDFEVRGRILDINIPTIERARELVKKSH